MRAVTVRVTGVLLYAFVLVLLYLAGMYVGPVYYFIYAVMLLLPILSIVHVALTLAGVTVADECDALEPERGQTVRYRLVITNRFVTPTSLLRVRFSRWPADPGEGPPEIAMTLPGFGEIEHVIPFVARRRGVHSLGLQSVEVADLFGWLTVRKPLAPREIVVYPRAVDLRLAPSARDGLGGGSGGGSAKDGDFSQLDGLTGYRDGFSARHIAWRKFLATGIPYLQEWGAGLLPGATIYLDSRRKPGARDEAAETEDASADVAASLARLFIASRVPTKLRSTGRTSGSERAGTFDEIRRSLARLEFDAETSPALALAADRAAGLSTATVVVVTHFADGRLLDLAPASPSQTLAVVVNRVGMAAGESSRAEELAAGIRGAQASVFFVDSLEAAREPVGR